MSILAISLRAGSVPRGDFFGGDEKKEDENASTF
jgi:hypothetical protein